MKFDARALSWQALSVALAAQMTLASTAEAAGPGYGHQGMVTCATPDMWTGKEHISAVAPLLSQPSEMAAPPSTIEISSEVGSGLETGRERKTWAPEYKGTGADRLQGADRARVMSYGVLWLVDPRELGVSEAAAISALLRSGAKIARSEGDGRVYFRALEKNKDGVAQRAAKLLGGTLASSPRVSMAVTKKPAGAFQNPTSLASFTLGVDVAMLRLEGRVSDDPISFIETLPGGMSVMPFGTSFVVHVPAVRARDLWDSLDSEGRRILLVGASSEVKEGSQVSQAIKYCGGSALMRRFPTPKVLRSTMDNALLEVEGQNLLANEGDLVMVLQAPAWGRGIEVAMMRFVGR